MRASQLGGRTPRRESQRGETAAGIGAAQVCGASDNLLRRTCALARTDTGAIYMMGRQAGNPCAGFAQHPSQVARATSHHLDAPARAPHHTMFSDMPLIFVLL